MRLGKYSIYLLICFFLNLEQSFCQTLSSQDIENLEDLPSTYEEEDFIEDDTENNEILKKIKYKEEKATNNNFPTHLRNMLDILQQEIFSPE